MPDLKDNFQAVITNHVAGDPMREDVKWTGLSQQQIADRLHDAGTPIGTQVVAGLLEAFGFRRRKAQKRVAMGSHVDRNAQFENIARLKREFLSAGLPIISIDTKKKELLGNFYRDGRLYTQDIITTFDHDFPSAASGKVVPHGIYDVGLDTGYLTLGTSCDTSEFSCDNIERWWLGYGQSNYPEADSVLMFCDCGGSNNASHYIFKEDLQKLSDRLGISIRVAHYPPYTSKYNPIEHRLFPHVTRACQGAIFHTIKIVRDLMAQTSTRTGLNVFVDIIEKVYETGRQYAADFKENMRIVFDDILPKWNYTAIPAKN